MFSSWCITHTLTLCIYGCHNCHLQPQGSLQKIPNVRCQIENWLKNLQNGIGAPVRRWLLCCRLVERSRAGHKTTCRGQYFVWTRGTSQPHDRCFAPGVAWIGCAAQGQVIQMLQPLKSTRWGWNLKKNTTGAGCLPSTITSCLCHSWILMPKRCNFCN